MKALSISNSGWNAGLNRNVLEMLDTFQSSTKVAYATVQLFTTAIKCVRIRRSSDSVEQDFGFVNGVIDDASIATFIGGGSGYITKFYNQSGNGLDAVQATTTKQPLYEANSIGTKGSVKFDGTDDTMRAASVFDSSFNTKLAAFEFSFKRSTSQTLSACANGGGLLHRC